MTFYQEERQFWDAVFLQASDWDYFDVEAAAHRADEAVKARRARFGVPPDAWREIDPKFTTAQ